MTEFEALYQCYAPHVRRFALFLGGDAALADDLTSEAFVRAWTAPGPLAQETIKAYLFTIVRNLYRDRLQESRHAARLNHDMRDERVSTEKQLEDRSELSRVLAEMQELPESDRVVLLMRAQEGMSYEEISQATGLSLSSVKVKIHRARLRLMKATRASVKRDIR